MKTYHHLWRQYHTWVGIVASGVLVAVGYGFSLQLPFFFDDLPIMTWLRHRNLMDVWRLSSENAYYRPLAFTVYKLGHLFPLGARQVVLRAVNLTVHWANGILIMQVVKLYDKSPGATIKAVLASVLFVVFPFVFLAIPWITALSHPLVTMLTLLAVYAALRAERCDHDTGATGWWGLSLLATTLAPFAHESGPMCSVIVGGLVVIQYGVRSGRRRITGIVLGGLLNVGGVLLRNYVPGVGEMQLAGLSDCTQNIMFFLHGLLYPVAPVIGWLVHRQGGHDLTLVKVATACLCLLLVWLAQRSRDWRWIARNLWWWACGALPAVVSLRFGDLYISPRLHALSSPGVVMLWAYIIFELGKLVRHAWGRRLVWGLLAGAIVIQNVAFLNRQRVLFMSLNHVYRHVLEAAEDENNAPLGFVNLPGSLAWQDKTYALILENVMFVPWYSSVGEFIEVNQGWRASDTVAYSPVIQDTEQVFGLQGAGIDWEQMRQFAIEHRTVWLTHYSLLPTSYSLPLPFSQGGAGRGGQFVLNQVGTITTGNLPTSTEPLVKFEDGPVIESASVQKIQNEDWAVTLTWLASGPVDGEIFVHVHDADNGVVAQADGPALGGMVPIWLWQSGDRIYDMRHITLPEGTGPYTVQVGVYNADGRFPAFVNDARCPDDSAQVATIVP